jgi:ATP-dependent helicase/nuclease subunit A
MSEALRRADELARQAALDPARSMLLQAPAGSGKTAVLTERYLRLLTTVDDPGEVLAVTFTRKAAAEMRGRVVRALRGELDPLDARAGELHELAQAALARGALRGWELARDAAALRIQTLDSFNYWLARQLPLASRAGALLELTETPRPLYRRAARATLNAADTDAAFAADADLLFERLDNHWERIERLIAAMLERRAHWLRFVLHEEPQSLCADIRATLVALAAERLAAAHALVPGPLRRTLEGLPGIAALGTGPTALAPWQTVARLALTKTYEWRKAFSERHLGGEYAGKAARAALAEAIGQLRQIAGCGAALREIARLPPSLSEADAAAIAALSRLLAHAAAQLQSEFALAGRVDHTYIAGAAHEALGSLSDPTDLALRAGLSLRHILVDEYQDTSLAQAALLATLTAGWEEGDGRTLFLVGDPMQSIYRFRDAEVGLFIATRTHGIGALRLAALRLTRNFRASPALIAWTNEVFARAFAPADDLRAGAVAFSASIAASSAAACAAEPEAVQVRIFPGDSAAEARALAARVAQLREHDARARIAVLTAAHAHAPPLVEALAQLGIEALGVDLVALADAPVVRDLVQLARALHDLADRSAWLAVLRSPWCGARLRTLSTLSAPEDPQLLWEALHDEGRLGSCEAGERERLLRVRTVLEAALARRERQSVADWLESTWLQLGAADAYGEAELADARALFGALAARAGAGEWGGPEDFPLLLEGLHSAAQAELANPVQIMTIHRAKGLEFDHVLVPALERSPGGSERALLRWIDLPRADGGSELLIAPAPPTGEEDPQDLGALIGHLLAQRAAHERTRLMYVAATRARRSLYLSAAPQVKEDGQMRPEPRSLLAALWPALGEGIEEELRRRGAVQESAVPARAPQPLRRLKEPWRAPSVPAPPALTHLPLARSAPQPPEFSWVGETQRHVGTVVHELLAQAAQAPEPPGPAALVQLRPQVLERLRLHGVPEDERHGAADQVVEALERTLADPRGRWILDSSQREAASELALTGIAGGRLRSVVIDRCFVDEQGVRWVIDYKSSRHEGGGLEEFLAQEIERYAEQLSSYVALARSLGPEPVRAALYFPLLGAFRELGAAPSS